MGIVLSCVIQDAPPTRPGTGASEVISDPRLLPPPGDPRLWTALESSVGELGSLRSRVLQAAWDDGARTPEFARVQEALRFPGLSEVERLDSALLVSFVIRGKGADCDSLALLFSDWCESSGFDRPREVWAGSLYELRPRAAHEIPKALADSADRLLTLGERSGIFVPSLEEAKVLRPGESLHWALPSAEPIGAQEGFNDLLVAAASPANSLLRGSFLLKEVRPRTPTLANEFSPALHALLWNWNNAGDAKDVGWGRTEGPVHFVVGLPSRPDSEDWSERLRAECERTASLLDRGAMFLSSRVTGTVMPWVDRISALPLVHTALPSTPKDPKSVLAFVGPWDARNPVQERRYEYFLRSDLATLASQSEFLEGSDSWLRRVSDLAPRLGNIEIFEDGLARLATLDRARVESQRLLFVWAQPDWLQKVEEAGLPMGILGQSTSEGGLRIGDHQLTVEDLASLARGPREVSWTYPELKSPTYGYEKATLFPDRYITKIMTKARRQSDWQEELWRVAGGERLRSAPYRNPACSSIDGFRWTDGTDLFAEAIGAVEGWSDVDPRAAGIAAVDSALRILVALGARPNGGGEAMVYMTSPALGEEGDAESVAQGSYLLAAQGICQALEGFRFHVRHFNGFGLGLGADRPELRVVLRTRLGDAAPQIVPGFRMSGEPLYAIGPRPAFVDAGSLLLGHVKVISNHLSKLHPVSQLELYDLIWGLMEKGLVTSIRPIREGGIAQTVAEMALWGGMGAQIRPNVPTIELFSGAPGRFLVGILPSETKKFESMIKSELLTPVGMTGGDKILGLPLAKIFETRTGVPT